jgi:hypothetical protein
MNANAIRTLAMVMLGIAILSSCNSNSNWTLSWSKPSYIKSKFVVKAAGTLQPIAGAKVEFLTGPESSPCSPYSYNYGTVWTSGITDSLGAVTFPLCHSE